MARKAKNGIPPLGGSGGPEPSLNPITLHGKKLVAGLIWEPLTSYRNYMAEAKRIGKSRKMEMVAIRKSPSQIQAGFAPRTKERLKGLYSFAAVLAGALGESWMGAFALSDGRYAFVTVIDGVVLPGQDIVGDRDKIEQALTKTYSLVTADPAKALKLQKNIIAPADFQFSNDNRTVEDILRPEHFKKEHLLKPLALGLTPREIVIGIVGLTAVGGIAVGASWWMERREAEKAQQAAMQQATELEKQKLEAQREIPQPWMTQPNAKLMLTAAAESLDQNPLSYGGWLFAESACDATRCAAIYSRPDGGSTIGAFLLASKSANGARLSDDKGVVYIQLALSPEKTDLLPPFQQQEFGFTNYFQSFGDYVKASLEDAAAPVAVPGEPVAPPATWTKKTFKVDTTFPPERLFEGLDVTGLRITNITARIPGSTGQAGEGAFSCTGAVICWSITGEIYGR